MPAEKDRIEIDGMIYQEEGWNPKFPWSTEKDAKDALPLWNNALWGKWGKTNGRFSVRKSDIAEKYHGEKCWGLITWTFIGYTNERIKQRRNK